MFIHWNIINCCLVLQVSSQGVRWGELSQKREGQRNSHVCLCALALALIAGRNRSLEARGVESSSHTATNDSANKRNDLLRAVFECGVIAAKGGLPVSRSLPDDMRRGEVKTIAGQQVQEHKDGTLTTMTGRPVVRNDRDREKFIARHYDATGERYVHNP